MRKWFISLLWLVSFASVAAAQTPAITVKPEAMTSVATTITLETFARAPFIEGPKLSPNGRYLAAKVANDEGQLLAMVPVFAGAEKSVAVNLGNDDAKIDVDWWSWVNDDWLVVGISSEITIQGEKRRFRRLLAINRITSKINSLLLDWQGYDTADVVWIARDGSPRIIVAAQNSIYTNEGYWPTVVEVDVSNRREKKLLPSRQNVLDYFADASGTVRMALGYNDAKRMSTLLYRPDANARFKAVDRADLGKSEQLITPDLFLAGSNQALTINGFGGYRRVYDLDLVTLTRGKQIFAVPNYDVDDLVPMPGGDALAGVRYTDTHTKIHWIDPEMAVIQASLDKAATPRRAQIISWSRNLRILLVLVGTSNTAGSYYLFNRDGNGAMKRLFDVDTVIKSQSFSNVSTITYKARDGTAISAILTLPQKAIAKNLPLIVLPHGGPHTRDAESWDWQAQYLAWRGYAVIQPNYRGSTGFGREFLDAGNGEWGLKMQDDLNDAITHLAEQGIADAGRVCIIGGSYGGYAALRAAQRDGRLFKCAISFAGVSDLASMRRYDSQFLYSNASKSYWSKQTPDLDAVSPLKHAEDFTTPTLIIHGKDDLRVPVEQSRRMAERLKSLGKPYRYVEQRKGDHHFSRRADRLEFLRETQAWLDRYNPVDTAQREAGHLPIGAKPR